MNRHCRILLSALVTALFLMTAPSGWAQTGYSDINSKARECGVFPETLERVDSLVREKNLTQTDAKELLQPLLGICAEKLPLAPFEDKLSEGLAKRVPPVRIVQALGAMKAQFLTAREIVAKRDGVIQVEALTTVGEGLAKGVPQSYFERYVSQFSGVDDARFLAGANVASMLGQIGFEYPLASSVLQAGFDSGTFGSSSQWRQYIRIVLIARQRGATDKAIAQATDEVLLSGGSLGDISSRLGFTSRDLTGRSHSN